MARTPGFTTHVTGTAAGNHDNAVSTKNDLAKADSITVPILIIILFLVFGTAVAGMIPLILAGMSITLSLALVYIFGHALDTSVYVTNVVTALGLGIGIDYSLFIVYRFREELQRTGGDVERSIVRTMETMDQTMKGYLDSLGPEINAKVEQAIQRMRTLSVHELTRLARVARSKVVARPDPAYAL